MNPLASILEPLRRLDLERMAGLRPSYPPVAVEIDRREMVLVRVQRRRRGRPLLEAFAAREMPEHTVGTSILRPNLTSPEETSRRLRELLEVTGTRPGRISLVLPDNLARVSLMSFPERPSNRKHLEELIRFKLRRTVPFRLEDAVLSYQELPGEGRELQLMVALMLRSVVEQYEQAAEAAGVRPGLVDLSTLALYNLCRGELDRARAGTRDVALLNCARGYFSLMIVRGSRPLFYRCKSHGIGEDEDVFEDSVLAREIMTSLSYYQEKLGGEGIATTYVRTVAAPFESLARLLGRLGAGDVVPLDPSASLEGRGNGSLDPETAQRIAPAAGAAAGRGR